MPIDKSPIDIDEFKGILWTDRNEPGLEKIPFDYAYSNTNIEFLKKGGIRSRHGIKLREDYAPNAQGVPVQFWRIDNLNGIPQTDRWLILAWDYFASTGYLYDTGVVAPAVNPVMTLVGMRHAFVINAFGRMYISPWSSWAEPLASQYIWVYNGLYNARLTQMHEPGVGPPAMAAVAVAHGVNPTCTPGLHYISVCFETDTGFLTTCPTSHIKTPVTVNTTVANGQINLTNIPVWAGVVPDHPAACVVARQIWMTKVVVNPDNNGFDSYEPFLVGRIGDNVTTIYSINMPDSGLVDSAKLLINQSQSGVRTHVGMAVYKNRMVYLGSRSYAGGDTFGLINSITYSPVNEPEQTRNTLCDGLRVVVGNDFSGKVMGGQELNGTFFIFKEDSTFSQVADDSLDPSEWATPALVDSARGAYPLGICNVGNNPSALQDGYLLIGGNHGISVFTGSFSPVPITEGLWEGLNPNDVIWVKIIADPIRKVVFFRIGDATDIQVPVTSMYHANYYYGLDIKSVRWSKFTYGLNKYNVQLLVSDIDMRPPKFVGLLTDPTINNFYMILDGYDTDPVLHQWGRALIYSEDSGALDYSGAGGNPSVYPIWSRESGLTSNDSGEVRTFGPLKLRIIGLTADPNSITVECRGLDGTYKTIGTLKLVTSPTKYYSFNLNEVSEHLQLKISGQCFMLLNRILLYFAKSAIERPRV